MRVTIEEIGELVCLQLGVAAVTAEDALIATLGAESADVMNLVATLEERFDVEIAEEELPSLRTVGDLHAAVCRRLGERS